MNENDLQKYYKILEIEDESTFQEIEYAYRLLKRIYSSESAATVPGMQEFSETRRLEFLADIEEAYNVLESQLKTRPRTGAPRNRRLEKGTPVTGQILYLTRTEIGVTLDEVSRRTKVGKAYLRALEMEDFSRLPDAAVYVRGFVAAYAQYLGFTVEDIVPPYMLRYNNWAAQKNGK